MTSRTLLAAALATVTTGALALGVPSPSHSLANAAVGGTSAASSTAGDGRLEQERTDGRLEQERAVEAARAYLAERGRTAVLAAPADRFQQVGATLGGAGTWYVAYERTHRGLPVVGGDFVLVVDDSGKVSSVSRRLEQEIVLGSVSPKETRAEAKRAAKGEVSEVDSASRPRLVVFAKDTPRLAWETEVVGTDAGDPSVRTVWTNAATGKVIAAHDEVTHGTGTGYYNGSVTIGTSGSGTSYSMSDPARPGVRCGGQDGGTYTGTDNVWGNGIGTNLETACVDVMYAVGKEWDMLSAWLGRNGIKGDGTGYPARVGLADVNAYYNGSITNYGHSSDNARQLTAMDIVAHENGHGIFATTPGGSTGDGETGGMNEATGDIFGALTEYYANNPNDPGDYLVGEEANLTGNGPIRNMYDPSALGDPNCWSTAIKNTEVHAAAGPLNHWFFLLAQGSGGTPASPTCNSTTVTGVGLQAAGKIFYNGLLQKTSYWTHGKARVATLTAAKNLYGTTDCTTFNKVKAAWAAVSVPAQSGEPTCGGTTPTACSEVTATGSVSARASSYKPSTSGFSAVAGTIKGCLTGPSGTDFDLYLQRYNGSSWVDVAAAETASSSETITYSATAGTYRWEVYAYAGSGSYTLKYDVP